MAFHSRYILPFAVVSIFAFAQNTDQKLTRDLLAMPADAIIATYDNDERYEELKKMLSDLGDQAREPSFKPLSSAEQGVLVKLASHFTLQPGGYAAHDWHAKEILNEAYRVLARDMEHSFRGPDAQASVLKGRNLMASTGSNGLRGVPMRAFHDVVERSNRANVTLPNWLLEDTKAYLNRQMSEGNRISQGFRQTWVDTESSREADAFERDNKEDEFVINNRNEEIRDLAQVLGNLDGRHLDPKSREKFALTVRSMIEDRRNLSGLANFVPPLGLDGDALNAVYSDSVIKNLSGLAIGNPSLSLFIERLLQTPRGQEAIAANRFDKATLKTLERVAAATQVVHYSINQACLALMKKASGKAKVVN
ncbi:MAG TPA: hypothetical protein VM901_11815 [Bdellovibrionota bacterium]|nr:hypothetical protein [Bdellovibrionota bacterium]